MESNHHSTVKDKFQSQPVHTYMYIKGVKVQILVASFSNAILSTIVFTLSSSNFSSPCLFFLDLRTQHAFYLEVHSRSFMLYHVMPLTNVTTWHIACQWLSNHYGQRTWGLAEKTLNRGPVYRCFTSMPHYNMRTFIYNRMRCCLSFTMFIWFVSTTGSHFVI